MSDNSVQKLEEFTQLLELPLRESELTDAIRRLQGSCPNNLSGGIDDYVILLNQQLEEWRQGSPPKPELTKAVESLLEDSEAASLGLSGQDYFSLYSSLQKGGRRDWRGLSSETARRLLSRSLFIYQSLKLEKMSTSQLARVFVSLESSLDVPYKAIQVIARHFKLLPGITVKELNESIWPLDVRYAKAHFTDDSLVDSCMRCQELCEKWVPENNLASDLLELTSTLRGGYDSNQKDFWPYIQILHWCTLPIELYDHPASHLYEFGPRGNVATELFGKYPDVATANPVLNNAKAVAQLDSHWARNRSGDDAHALVRILQLLESLPFSSRRQIGRIIRGWLVRLIELKTGTFEALEVADLLAAARSLSGFIVHSESKTRGVIEQRVVDALSVLAFQSNDWKAKGLGDSVNASSFSCHKLGDVEFANVDERRAIGIEAHGGRVSSVYVDDHRKSLSRIVEQRLGESWESIDTPENWEITVLFVAHEFADDLPSSDVLFGVSISYQYWHYQELVDKAFVDSSPDAISEAFGRYFLYAMNQTTVPQWVRDIARTIL